MGLAHTLISFRLLSPPTSSHTHAVFVPWMMSPCYRCFYAFDLNDENLNFSSSTNRFSFECQREQKPNEYMQPLAERNIFRSKRTICVGNYVRSDGHFDSQILIRLVVAICHSHSEITRRRANVRPRAPQRYSVEWVRATMPPYIMPARYTWKYCFIHWKCALRSSMRQKKTIFTFRLLRTMFIRIEYQFT